MASKDVLTEDELGALMETVSGDPAESVGDDGEFRTYDFARREKALLSEIPALKVLLDRQILELSQGLIGEFNFTADINIAESRVLKVDEFSKLLPINSGINLLKVSPLAGVSALVVPGGLMSMFVDINFGGQMRESYEETEERHLTSSELRINQRLLEVFFKSVVKGWSDMLPIKPESVDFETNPDFANLGHPENLAVLITFEMVLADKSIPLMWMLPYAAINTIKQRVLESNSMALPEPAQDEKWGVNLQAQLRSLVTDLNVLLVEQEMPMGEVLSLKQGDILPLEMPPQVLICADSEPVAIGQYGAHNGKKAVKVLGALSSDGAAAGR